MIVAVIPSRYMSSRFPGKPLACIQGKTMIQRVYEQAVRCPAFHRVLVATDDERIAAEVRGFGGAVMMTDPTHPSGTSRCAEAVRRMTEQPDVVVNIQGDEPFVSPEQLSLLCSLFNRPEVHIATLIKHITRNDELMNPSVVKVVTDTAGRALYFSRSPIPYRRDIPADHWAGSGLYYKHIGLYGFRADILQQLVALPPHELEKAESLEQLRWLAHGFRIQTAETSHDSLSVDTPEDLARAEKFVLE